MTPDALAVHTIEMLDAKMNAFLREQAVPPELETICVRATARNLQDRYESPRELADVLEARGGITTVETCAIALAMAGGRPEYLPVLIAAVEACLEPEALFDQLQATSGGPFPVVIVNGPIAKDIRLNSGFGCLGPDPQRPAGASIGRALRLMQQNVGGALPGIGTMAIYGAMRYTNAVFAEDEASLPEGWEPHGTRRHGFPRGSNSVSVYFASGVTNIRRRGAKKETPEEDVTQGLYRMADFMRTPNFAALARSYGLFGEVVDDDADFPAVFDRALAANQPALIELRVDPDYISPDKTIAELRAPK